MDKTSFFHPISDKFLRTKMNKLITVYWVIEHDRESCNFSSRIFDLGAKMIQIQEGFRVYMYIFTGEIVRHQREGRELLPDYHLDHDKDRGPRVRHLAFQVYQDINSCLDF